MRDFELAKARDNRPLSRRSLAGVLLAAARPLRSAEPTIGFGFGTYGMKTVPTEKALRAVAEIGYDGIELALMPGWPTAPALLSKADRRRLRAQAEDLQLAAPALLESLPLLRGRDEENLARLERACELAHDLSPARPPVVQTTLGGKTAEWDDVKHTMAEELGKWAEVGERTSTVVCFKPHAAHAVHDVGRTQWLHGQVGSDWLKVVYDYSHFYLEGLTLAESLLPLLPIIAYVQVKDSRGTPADHTYLLPGDGHTDYVELLRILKERGYEGFVNAEVSVHVHRQEGYEPIPTAALCYRRLAPLFEEVGIRRPIRRW